MHFLLCNDGSPEAESAARFAAPLAGSVGARITLFGVAEREGERAGMEKALGAKQEILAALSGVRVDAVVRVGEPTREILARTMLEEFDLVILGARRKAGSGQFWRSARVYELMKAVAPPVLVVVGRRERLGRVLICAGTKRYVHSAIQAASRLATPMKAAVTLLHVIPEAVVVAAASPVAAGGGVPRLPEDDGPGPLSSGGGGGDAETLEYLQQECAALIAAGVPAEVRVRRGLLLREIAEELRVGDYDLVVTGTTQEAGPIRQYTVGGVTREIVNRAGCPVLVVRSDPPGTRRLRPIVVRRSGLTRAWQDLFGGETPPPPPAAGGLSA